MQPPIAVVKASAGSGKTYRLSRVYLDLLLGGEPQRYKHILAVTFTNKATAEMKARVIEELYKLSRSDDPRAPLAAERLGLLLHDYSCFSVSTIDKFFQTVMRAFAREIGQYASYRVELDDEAVLSQVVDQMLDSLEDPAGGALLQWLKDYAFDLVEQGKNWRISGPLLEMAGHFLDESFLLKMRRLPVILSDKEKIAAFRKKLDGMTDGFEKEARRIADEALALMGRYGRLPEEFKWKKAGPMTVFRKWAAGDFAAPNAARLRQAFDDFPGREALSVLVEEAIAHYEKGVLNYKSALVVRGNLHLLGIHADVLHHLQAYLQENNVVLLRQSSDLLSRVIADDDTPFVYEKIGNRYDHLLLDEAQDTSLLQWDDFKPLFRNSVAQGSQGLVVGDIKQSIYRWRGSDWRLLSEYIYRDLGPSATSDETLSENWRSGGAVIGFNNRIFTGFAEAFRREPGLEQVGDAVGRIYDDCAQRLPAQHRLDPDGYVRLGFVWDTGTEEAPVSWRENALERMLRDIASLRQEGYDNKDITVLVRKNGEGGEVASFLIDHGISVLTEDSLQIGASPCIGRLMALLSHEVDPEDPVGVLMTEQLDVDASLIEAGSLYETCEQLLELPALAHTEADLPFIHAFLDAVLAYQEKYGSSLRGFVKWWDETGRRKAICAPDGQNAVRVMTIHKSKGLDLEAVIIPFADEPFVPSSQLQPTLWCETPDPFSELGLIPLKASSRLLETCFAADFMAETVYQHIDVVNTWYVAFTRARTRLLVYAPRPAHPDNYKLKRVGDLLYRLFSQELLCGDEDAEMCFCESGIRQPFARRGSGSVLVDDPQPAFSRVAMTSDRLRLSLHGDDYFAQEESARQRGIARHRELAAVEVDASLEARSGGRHWFDGSFRVLNEASIVSGQGEIFRPDRVLVSRDGSRVVVIDYKFGQPYAAHKRQVRDYVTLLRGMGYASVEGWLWYLKTDEVVQVS